MKILLVLVTFCTLTSCKDLMVGESSNKGIIHEETVELYAIPYVRRYQEVFYSNNQGKKIKVSTCNKFKLKSNFESALY